MVHGVFHREHLPDRCSLPALATAPVMSADGSWFEHEHLTDRCSFALLLPHVSRLSADGVCNHEHLPDMLFSRLRCYSATRVSRWFMEVCTHEHLPRRCSLFALRLLLPVMSADGSWSVALMNICQIAVLSLCACYSISHVGGLS
jgi:hypothetical protein